jgi:hypothetical protein
MQYLNKITKINTNKHKISDSDKHNISDYDKSLYGVSDESYCIIL